MILVHAIGSYCAVIAFCIILCVPKKYLNLSGIVGAVGWLLYKWMTDHSFNEMLDMFLAALVVSVMSHIFARWKKAPVTLFLFRDCCLLFLGSECIEWFIVFCWKTMAALWLLIISSIPFRWRV